MDDIEPSWDKAFGQSLIGAVVLVGITYEGPADQHQEQFYGTVEKVGPDGVELLLSGSRAGERFTLPPDPTAFERAAPGLYRLRESGDEIEDPDYISTWTINPPEH